ncbi:hypothetical protein, partial [Salmonella enterica]|uniref:hypothetical protein n=1 Tax=Salmonella enterica TaxID=28901 RepID=UPI003CF01B46
GDDTQNHDKSEVAEHRVDSSSRAESRARMAALYAVQRWEGVDIRPGSGSTAPVAPACPAFV